MQYNFSKENLFMAFNFAYDRQQIYTRKEIFNEQPPWTTDTILQQNKFCNIYRQNDKVSKYIIKNVVNNDNLSPEDKILNIIMARMTNSPFMFISDSFGINTIEGFNKSVVCNRVERLQAELKVTDDTLFPQVYRIVPKKGQTKAILITNAMQTFVDNVKSGKFKLETLMNIKNPQQAALYANNAIGVFNKPSFVFYQMLLDMAWFNAYPFDGNGMLVVGPGSVKGGQIIHGLPQNDKNPDKDGAPLIRRLHGIQQLGWKSLKDRTGKDWYSICENEPLYETEFDGQLSLMDVQNWMCEFRKYYNIKANDGIGGKKYRSTNK